MSILKQQYNKLLAREKKAQHFLKTASNEEVDKWLPEYTKIIIQLSRLIYKIQEEEGGELSKEELQEGFKEVVNN